MISFSIVHYSLTFPLEWLSQNVNRIYFRNDNAWIKWDLKTLFFNTGGWIQRKKQSKQMKTLIYRGQLYMVMWSHWNQVEKRLLIIQINESGAVSPYIPAGRSPLWIPSQPCHILEIWLRKFEKYLRTKKHCHKCKSSISSIYFTYMCCSVYIYIIAQ